MWDGYESSGKRRWTVVGWIMTHQICLHPNSQNLWMLLYRAKRTLKIWLLVLRWEDYPILPSWPDAITVSLWGTSEKSDRLLEFRVRKFRLSESPEPEKVKWWWEQKGEGCPLKIEEGGHSQGTQKQLTFEHSEKSSPVDTWILAQGNWFWTSDLQNSKR